MRQLHRKQRQLLLRVQLTCVASRFSAARRVLTAEALEGVFRAQREPLPEPVAGTPILSTDFDRQQYATKSHNSFFSQVAIGCSRQARIYFRDIENYVACVAQCDGLAGCVAPATPSLTHVAWVLGGALCALPLPGLGSSSASSRASSWAVCGGSSTRMTSAQSLVRTGRRTVPM